MIKSSGFLLLFLLTGCFNQPSRSPKTPPLEQLNDEGLLAESVPTKAQVTVIPVTPVIPVAPPKSRIGKLELRFNQISADYNEEFTVYVENKSNKTVSLNKATFDLVGSINNHSYLSEPDLSITAIGSCPITILANGACFIRIKNDSYLAPNPGSEANVIATINVQYIGESNWIKEKSSQNTTPVAWDNTLNIYGP